MDLEYYHDWQGKYGVDELPGDLVSFFATNLIRATISPTRS